MPVFISICYIQSNIFLKPSKWRGSMTFLAHPLSLWHLLTLVFVSICLQVDCHVQQHRQIKDHFSASYAFSCLGKLLWISLPFMLGCSKGWRAGKPAAECNTTGREPAGQWLSHHRQWESRAEPEVEPASAHSLGHQARVSWGGRSIAWKPGSQAAGQGQNQGQRSPGESIVMRWVCGLVYRSGGQSTDEWVPGQSRAVGSWSPALLRCRWSRDW